MAYHKRILVINYSDNDLPRFQSDEEHSKWLQAVGRMVVYGMHANDDSRGGQLELVTGGFTKNPVEFDCCYWPRLSNDISSEGAYSDNPTVKADRLVAELRNDMGDNARPFVIGAVLHGDGHWGFHS